MAVTGPGYYPFTSSHFAVFAGMQPVKFELRRIQLLEGWLLDTQGNAVANATVSLRYADEGLTSGVSTDADGFFFKPLRPEMSERPYFLEVIHPAYERLGPLEFPPPGRRPSS